MLFLLLLKIWITITQTIHYAHKRWEKQPILNIDMCGGAY